MDQNTSDTYFHSRVCVETVEDYKYLSVHMGNKPDFIKITEALYKQGQSGLYFLRLLRCFIICQLLRIRLWWPVFLCYGVLRQQTKGSRHQQTGQTQQKASDILGVALADNIGKPFSTSPCCAVISHKSTFSRRLMPPRSHRIPVAVKL